MPVGELKRWFATQQARSRHGPEWLIAMFEMLGLEVNAARITDNRDLTPRDLQWWLLQEV